MSQERRIRQHVPVDLARAAARSLPYGRIISPGMVCGRALVNDDGSRFNHDGPGLPTRAIHETSPALELSMGVFATISRLTEETVSFDFTASQHGFSAVIGIPDNTGRANYVGGVGWQSVYNKNGSGDTELRITKDLPAGWIGVKSATLTWSGGTVGQAVAANFNAISNGSNTSPLTIAVEVEPLTQANGLRSDLFNDNTNTPLTLTGLTYIGYRLTSGYPIPPAHHPGSIIIGPFTYSATIHAGNLAMTQGCEADDAFVFNGATWPTPPSGPTIISPGTLIATLPAGSTMTVQVRNLNDSTCSASGFLHVIPIP